MSARILDGKSLAESIEKDLKQVVVSLSHKPKLVIVQVGNNIESDIYIGYKKRFAERVGVDCIHERYTEDEKEEKIIDDIVRYGNDTSVTGIMVQLPLPQNFNTRKILDTIPPAKDVDGLTSHSLTQLLYGGEAFLPAVAHAVFEILENYNISIFGKKVVVVGKSELVGKPIALKCMNMEATVSVCHSNTINLAQETQTADILIVGAGSLGLVGREGVRTGQVVIDIGTNPVSSGPVGRRVAGDVRFEEVLDIVSDITPVPGGVGPVTVACLFKNLLEGLS